MKPAIHYTVTPLIPRNVFAITMDIQNNAGELDVYLPNWIPGSYMLRDFAQHIIRISARDEQHQAIHITPINQSSWHVAAKGNLTLEYEVYAHDTSVRTAFLDDSGGFFNGTSVFLSVHKMAHATHVITFKPPTDQPNWQVATTLTRHQATAARSFGTYQAVNYDELIDHPVRMGHLTWLDFEAAGVAHEVAIAGALSSLNTELLRSDLQRICNAQIDFFQTRAPFSCYLFMIDAREQGYGGLEHRDSTALLCRRTDLPSPSDTDCRSDDYLTFLGLCSHEYFHAWNVKRLKPAAFVEYDLTQPIDTSLLWFFEGLTSYYDDLFLLRVGILNEAQYFKKIESTLNAVSRHAGARTQNLIESGFYAWTKYYHTSPNTPNAVVSYYTKGALVGWAIDLFIRQASEQKHSLDDVMRDLWLEFGHEFYQRPRGLLLADIIRVCAAYAPTITPLIQAALFTTDALPLDELLHANGMMLRNQTQPIELGAAVQKCDGGYQVTRVFDGGSAQQAKLAPNDILLSFDRIKLTQKPDEILAQCQLQQKIKVHFLREGMLQKTTLIAAVRSATTFELMRITPDA